jgi:MFS family permease
MTGTRLPPASTAATAVPAYRVPAFLRYATGEMISVFGDEISYLCMAYAVAGLTTPGMAGLVLATPTLPRVAVMVLGGPLADRFDARRLLMAVQAGCALVMFTAAAVLGSPHVPVIVAILLTVGAVDALTGPVVSSVAPRLLHRDQLAGGAALRALAGQGGSTAGALAGGFLMVTGGLRLGCAADGVTFLLACAAVWSVRPRPVTDRPATGRAPGYFSSLRDGLRFIARHRLLRQVFAVNLLLNLGFVGPMGVGVALLSHHRRWDATGLAAIMTGCAIGAAVSAAAMLRLTTPRRPALVIGTGGIAMAGALAGLAVTPSLPVAVGCAAALGLIISPPSITVTALIQHNTPDDLRGRVSGVGNMIFTGVVPATTGLTGLAASAWGITPALLLSAAVAASTGAACLALPELRRRT